ncbi:nucleolar protein 11 [Copidosoma floridanum]|uniref:nucleolar protein 11 n=1 Tax=Copidosoma floridanum TaxID=29053 RepID=UPI0006C9CF69|nr:nucleolar protein 11 [Copidosoma floridanum]
MARLSSYYTLCPLIDQQNLLGVETDSSPGCAIVTLGKNIVIRYKLQDLKQVSSWSTKERLSTKVIFDEILNNYVAVFNGKNIRIWKEEETNLDSVKKYKFLSPIHTILTFKDGPPILVLQNGATASLTWALENRKNWDDHGILKPDEKILNCQLVFVKEKLYLCALLNMEQTYSYIVVPLKRDSHMEGSEQHTRLDLKRSSETLVGHVLLHNDDNAHLLTLWSHGRLYSYPLIGSASESIPGSLVSVLEVVKTSYPVVMVALNESTIAGYGADSSEEGAVLFIYNVQFKLVQAVQKLKLYTAESKLWKIEDKLLLAANRHLAIAPYNLEPQRLKSMLGSTLNFKNNNLAEDDIVVVQESEVADWGKALPSEMAHKVPVHKLKSSLATQISASLREGTNDATIHNNIIPQLIESKDVSSILWCLENLKEVPVESLLQILTFSLKTDICASAPNGCLENSKPSVYETLQSDLLNKILEVQHTDISLVSYLKTGLNFDATLKLLSHLICKLDDEATNDDQLGSKQKLDNSQLYEWVKLLLDSHYQDYILSQDGEVLVMFEKLKIVLDDHFELLRDLGSLRALIKRVIDGKPLTVKSNDVSRLYSIEAIKLY